MAYVDGFVIAVPTARRQEFIDHARRFDALFLESGATRVMEAWATTWPDKATRDRAMKAMENDARMNLDENPMPFDGKRMIYGGFAPVVDLS